MLPPPGLSGTDPVSTLSRASSNLESIEYPPPGVSNLRRWSIVSLLFAASMINYMDRATLSMALPVLSKDLALGPTAKGVLTSAFFWSYALMQVPIGWCADRFDLRRLYAVMFAIWSLACGLTGSASSLAMLILLRIILGFGESIYLPGGIKIVSLLFPPGERGLPSGLFDSGTRTGLVLDGVLLPWLIVAYGWPNMFRIVGFTCLLWIIPWLMVYPRGLRSRHAPAEAGPEFNLKRLWEIVRSRNLFGICLGFFCFDYFWYVMLFWLTDFLVNAHNLPLRRAGFYASLTYFIFAVCEPAGGWLADWLIRLGFGEGRTRKGVISIAFLAGLCLIPAARARSVGATLALVFASALVGLATGNLHAVLQSCAPAHEVSVWTGVENFAGNFAGAVAQLVMGVTLGRSGSYFTGFAVGALALVIGSISYSFVVGELRPLPSKTEA
jgi:MFS transporter, ACS family, D-galactonate transporter